VKSHERQSRVVIASLFVTLFFVFGSGYNTAGVFFAPMLQHFGWSRTRLSSLQTALALATGVTVPAVGWLLDRIEARFVIFAGIAFAGSACIIISRAHSYGVMLTAYALLGLGISAATLLPCSLVVANWFDERRGAALGIVMAGTSVGGMVMTLVAQRSIDVAGWRIAFVILALPMLLVAAPLVLATVSTRPEGGKSLSLQEITSTLPGMEIGQALKRRSFWMIAAAQFCYSFASAAATLYTVSYLVFSGYGAGRAAQIWSVTFGLATAGKLLAGYAADYLTGRITLALTLALMAVGQICLLGAQITVMLIGYTLLYGLMSGAPLALIPMVLAESLGLKRFGSLGGLTGVFITAGAAAGPLVAGWMLDRGIGYSAAFTLLAGTLALGALVSLACLPLGIAGGSGSDK